MHRPGADPGDMQPADFLCDFCHTPWDGAFPMIEGHRGSLICGRCLSVAYTELVLLEPEQAEQELSCTMCLEKKTGPFWVSPSHESAQICLRCTKQSAGKLHSDPDWDWHKPTLGPANPRLQS